jgi:large subunit ribosomal protein L12e
LETIYDIARKLKFKSYAKSFDGNVKEILGTAHSIGCTVEGEAPHDLIEKIQAGELVVPEA